MANRRSTARDLAQIAIFAALIAALGLPGTITVGPTGVPITLQTLGVMLAGGILGARKGFLSVLVFLRPDQRRAAAAGRGPRRPGDLGGAVRRLPGRLPGRRGRRRLADGTHPAEIPAVAGHLVNLIGGALVIYLFGVTWLAFRIGLGAAFTGALPFLPGDLLKAVVAALVVKQVHRSYPGLIASTAAASPPTAKVSS